MEKTCCEECDGKLFFDLLETYCSRCGLVTEDVRINFGKESAHTNADGIQKTMRSGPPTTWREPFIGSTFDLRWKKK